MTKKLTAEQAAEYHQKAAQATLSRTGLTKRAARHALRYPSARHLLKSGYDIRTVQELLGHKNVMTAMIYTHVLNRGGKCVKSPVDDLPISNKCVLCRNHISPHDIQRARPNAL